MKNTLLDQIARAVVLAVVLLPVISAAVGFGMLFAYYF
jgi:hypothetical protein